MIPHVDQLDRSMLHGIWLNYSGNSQRKARALVEEGRVLKDTETLGWVFKVKGSKTYRVQLYPGAGMSCTCPNGTHLGGQPQCYHSCAVILALLRALDRIENRDET